MTGVMSTPMPSPSMKGMMGLLGMAWPGTIFLAFGRHFDVTHGVSCDGLLVLNRSFGQTLETDGALS
ncbi:hypothetical protein HMPREF9371_0149 [Neisseria shayeganii 871]|uniref:Uncharacterized protein n=1 Tax=Neisseria shayeganii 871 TaxID=1032488 RepID=G4CEW0_9NEIS|nr:hypothetical protein HMPREF9371_0149 [Neisseria shayeganii 871]